MIGTVFTNSVSFWWFLINEHVDDWFYWKFLGCDVTLVGKNGLGYLCNAPEESEDEEEKEEVEDIWGLPEEENDEEEEDLTESSSSRDLGPGEEVSEESDGAEEDYDYEATCKIFVYMYELNVNFYY